LEDGAVSGQQDQHQEETSEAVPALDALVRLLACAAARQAFAESSAAAGDDPEPEDEQ
jgi:hypothetical protein